METWRLGCWFGAHGELIGMGMTLCSFTHDLGKSFWLVVPNGNVDNFAKFQGNWVCVARVCFRKCRSAGKGLYKGSTSNIAQMRLSSIYQMLRMTNNSHYKNMRIF